MPRKAITDARALRKSGTEAERRLWHYLRAERLHPHKFRRQHPIDPYIVDFVCLAAKLVIEVDGGQHDARRAHDLLRDRYLSRQGYKVLRFWNHDVLGDTDVVLEVILAELRNRPSP